MVLWVVCGRNRCSEPSQALRASSPGGRAKSLVGVDGWRESQGCGGALEIELLFWFGVHLNWIGKGVRVGVRKIIKLFCKVYLTKSAKRAILFLQSQLSVIPLKACGGMKGSVL